MKILWTVNLIPSDAAEKLGVKSDVLGGWVESMANALKKNSEVTLAIACKCGSGVEFRDRVSGIEYYSLPYGSKTKLDELEKTCTDILKDFEPDIVHIEGTEFLHAKAMMNASKKLGKKCVVSLQGIHNGCYQYECGQLQIDDMMFSRSLTNIFAAWILRLRKTIWFRPRMKHEKEVIEQAEYILGRTTWDRAHSYALNSDAKYYSVNRNLRRPFYEASWNSDRMERHSIYVGNGYFALKGLHFVVEALPQLIREYPDIKVYVAGTKPFSDDDKRRFYKKGYGAYLKKRIKDLGVDEHIVFTGPLKADEVADRLSRVNAYVLCSAIENSPNTLGEAMAVGAPCIAAYVGGVPDMATDGEEALFYRNDDPAMLAWSVKRIFDSDELALSLSKKARIRAAETHDTAKNAEKLYCAYREIVDDVR